MKPFLKTHWKDNSTGNPKPIGECPQCGWMTYLGIFHSCPTAPKNLNPLTGKSMYAEKEIGSLLKL